MRKVSFWNGRSSIFDSEGVSVIIRLKSDKNIVTAGRMSDSIPNNIRKGFIPKIRIDGQNHIGIDIVVYLNVLILCKRQNSLYRIIYCLF